VTEKRELIEELNNGVFKRISFLTKCKYFISANGRVLSLNSAEPRELQVKISSSRKRSIVLYTPALKSFYLDELILRVYEGEPTETSFMPEYKDGDPDNCVLANLRWGNKDCTVDVESTKAISKAVAHFQSRDDSNQSDTYIINDAIKNNIVSTLLQITRATLISEIDKQDITLMNIFIDELTRTISTNIIVIETFLKSVPEELINIDLEKAVKELKRDIETNISLYSVKP
jgi:hypothetical protein